MTVKPPAYPVFVRPDANLRLVAPGLYLGDVSAPRVRFGPSRKPYYNVRIDLVGQKPGEVVPFDDPDVRTSVRWLRYPVEDGEPMTDRLLTTAFALAVAYNPRNPVLVHCAAGLSRSASLVYGLLVARGVSHAEALRRVRVAGYEHFPMPATLRSVRRWLARQGYNVPKTAG